MSDHICKCVECGREMPPWTVVEVKPINCPRCGGYWLSIPRMGIYHVCPDGNGPIQDDFLKAGLFTTITVPTTSLEDSP